MRSIVAAGLMAVTAVQALSDSSPFALFSTTKFSQLPSDAQLQTSSRVISTAKDILASCPTSRYVLVSQPNLHASDLRGPSGCLAPNLCQAIASDKVQGEFSVAEVLGNIAMDDLAGYIKASCLGKVQAAQTDEYKLPPLPVGMGKAKRSEVLGENDHELGDILAKYERDGDYTVVYLSTPHEAMAYESDFIEPVHMELKRQSGAVAFEKKKGNSTTPPLFEKYQFFTPGIFMGIFAALVLVSILYVGLSALASLQVSYGAFEKDMGPAVQKKQQ